MNRLLLDTHVWIWYVTGDRELSSSLVRKINESLHDHEVYLAAISLWELCMLDQRKRITLGMPCLEWIKKALALTNIQIAPLSPEVAVESANLPGKFHGDPADQMIVASARLEGLTLVTRDKKILSYSKNHYLSVLSA